MHHRMMTMMVVVRRKPRLQQLGHRRRAQARLRRHEPQHRLHWKILMTTSLSSGHLSFVSESTPL